MKLRILIALSLTLSAALTRAQNIDTLPALTGAQADPANDKLLVRDASVTASAQALRTMTLQEYWNALGGTNVSTTELGYLDGVTSAIQTQINGKVAYDPSNTVIVPPAATDTARGTALVAGYAAAKLLTPNGSALSARNRATVVIPVGNYKLAATLVLDADFVDLIAQTPTKPTRHKSDEFEDAPEVGASNLGNFKPQPTLIYCEVDFESTITQTADDVRMYGFSVAQLCAGVGFITESIHTNNIQWGALLLGQGCNNESSTYEDMYFWTTCTSYITAGGVRAYESFSGTWKNCISNSASFRVGYGDLANSNAIFSAKMYDCEAGPFSFIGDYIDGSGTGHTENAVFVRCKSHGYSWEANAGASSFAGCVTFGLEIQNTCLFVECESGDKSFGLGTSNAGTYLRCRGGAKCFGSTTATDAFPGNFSGYAEDCHAGGDSFGGTDISGFGKCTGTLVRCTGEGNTQSMRLEGATIRDSRITTTTTGIHALTLLDSNSVISNSDIIVLQGGTGLPIYATSALNVAAYALRMNNASNDADGLGANVTNLVTSANNVVSNAVE